MQPFSCAAAVRTTSASLTVPSSSADTSTLGTIRVEVWVRGPSVEPGAVEDLDAAAAPAVEEIEGDVKRRCSMWLVSWLHCLSTGCAGRKWWKDATLGTQAGPKASTKELLHEAFHVPGAKKADVSLRLEQALPLLLRGVLQISNPVHRALLTQYGVPPKAIKAAAEDQARAAATSTAQPAGSAARAGSESPVLVVPARAIKRELIDLSDQAPPSQRARTAAAQPVKRELVDLT